MKYAMFLICMLAVSSYAISQSCHSKSMAAAKSAGCCAMKSASAMAAADKEGIQVRKDVATGDLQYYRASSCAHSGTTSYVQVSYDAVEKKFVNQAPDVSADAHFVPVSSHSTEMKKMDCSKMSKAECAEKMAKGECQMKAKS